MEYDYYGYVMDWFERNSDRHAGSADLLWIPRKVLRSIGRAHDSEISMFGGWRVEQEHLPALEPYLNGRRVELDKFVYQIECCGHRHAKGGKSAE